jgi:hypothetical protein
MGEAEGSLGRRGKELSWVRAPQGSAYPSRRWQTFSAAPDWARCHYAGMRATNPGRRCAMPAA